MDEREIIIDTSFGGYTFVGAQYGRFTPQGETRESDYYNMFVISPFGSGGNNNTVGLKAEKLRCMSADVNIQLSIKKQYPSYNPDGYVFCQENGDPYEPRTYEDLFKRCVRQAGIKDANFHALRHTFAIRSLEQDMDVVTLSKLLGHANPSVTMYKYGHAIDDHKRQSVQRLDDLYSQPPNPQSAPNDPWMKMQW